jgi:kumamolisin
LSLRLLTLLLGISFVLLPGGTSAPRAAAHFLDLSRAQQIPGAFTPDQIETAHDFHPLYDANIDGSGQTVALIEVDDFDPADIAAFDHSYDLPAPVIKKTRIGGKHYALGHDAETSLDIEWLHALAPGAAIHLYYLNNNLGEKAGWKAMALAVEKAVHAGAGIISISLGLCQSDRATAPTQKAFEDAFHHNVSIFVSSGDDGDHPGPVSDCGSAIGIAYPGSDPYVTSVGGTALSLNTDGSIAQEIAWHDSQGSTGGGSDARLVRRPWQHAPTMPAGTQRWDPDVAFLGAEFEVRFGGRWSTRWGTSLGAPGWAAIWALVRERVMNANEQPRPAGKLLYRAGNSPDYAADFHDVTAGSNGTYHAGPGWDPVTGWGTPDVAHLADSVLTWSQ